MNRCDGRTKALWASILLAVAYLALVDLLETQPYTHLVRGSIGVIVGLYMCSHPAATAVDILFFNRGGLRQLPSGWSGAGWIALNALVVALGWFVITSGMSRLVQPVG